MKSRCDYWAALAIDMAEQCSVDATHDIETVVRRVAAEGDTFFKVTLPQFAKDLELALSMSLIGPNSFVGFRRGNRKIQVGAKAKKFGHGTPVFLGGFMRQIFDDSYSLTLDEYLNLQDIADNESVTLKSFAEFLPPLLKVSNSEEELDKMANAIAAVRQLCLVYAKESEVPTPEVVASAVEGYKSCEQEILLPFQMGGSTAS